MQTLRLNSSLYSLDARRQQVRKPPFFALDMDDTSDPYCLGRVPLRQYWPREGNCANCPDAVPNISPKAACQVVSLSSQIRRTSPVDWGHVKKTLRSKFHAMPMAQERGFSRAHVSRIGTFLPVC